jgi:hypothetical protein
MDSSVNHFGEGECSILHLSDLHFGPYRREISDRVIEKIADDISQMNISIDAVVVTGDLVEAALPSQYALVLNSLLKLQEIIRVPKEHWIFAPGNHDVNLDVYKSGKLAIRGGQQDNAELQNEKFNNYKQFLLNFYGKKYKEDQITEFVEGGAAVIVNESIPVVIGILNSCKRVTIKDSSGYIEEDQLNRLSMNFSKNSPEMYSIRIAAMHHSFLPTPNPLEQVSNYEEVRRKLETMNVRIILHGHRHVSCPDIIRRPWEDVELIVLPTGSTSLGVSVLQDVRNRYQILSINACKKNVNLRVRMRVFESKGSAPALQGVWCPDVAYAENGLLQVQLKSCYAPLPLAKPELIRNNVELFALINRTIPEVPDYVQVNARSGLKTVRSIAPSIFYPEQLGNVKRILLVGACGIGKSTTLCWLAHECLKKRHLTKINRIPIFFDLKHYSNNTSLWNNILASLVENGANGTQDILRDAMKQGALLLFLDSFDEAPDRKVLDEIEGLVTLGNVVMVACRSSFLFENMSHLFANYSKIELGEWSYEQTSSFLQKKLSEKMDKNTINFLCQNIPPWVRTPLLLELFCQFLLEQRDDVINIRKQSMLYEKVIDRAIAYSRDNIAIPEKYVDIRRRILTEIAWQMFISNTEWLKAEEVDKIVSRFVEAKYTSTQFSRILIDTPIISWIGNKVTFRHIAFQEYLIAKKIIELIRSGCTSQLPQIPRDEIVAFVGEMVNREDLPTLAELAINSGEYWILGLVSKFSSWLLKIFEDRLEQLYTNFKWEQHSAIRLIWCIGELRLRSRKIRSFLEKIFDKCDETTADIAWFTAFAIEKIWAIEQLPHYALQKLVTKYSSVTNISLSSKLSCIISVANKYGKYKTLKISEDEIIRVIAEAEYDDPKLYNALWIAGSCKMQNATEVIIDLINVPPTTVNLFVYNCAIEALGKIGSPRSLEALLNMLSHPSLRLRWRALEALSFSTWGRRQLKRLEFGPIIMQIFSQIDLVGTPFEKERSKKTKERLKLTDVVEHGETSN